MSNALTASTSSSGISVAYGDGKTVVSYYRAAPAFAAYGKDNLKMAGEMMDKMLDEIVAEATK